MDSNNNSNNDSSNNNASSSTEWQLAKPLDINARTIETPAVATLADQLVLVWTTSDHSLAYSIGTRDSSPGATLFDSAAWEQGRSLPYNTKASAAPALASHNGALHLVFPDEQENLIHIQYADVDGEPGWCRRVGLGVAVSSAEPVSLVSFEGSLWCVHKKHVGPLDGRWCYLKWTDVGGWSESQEITGPPTLGVSQALVELKGKLLLLIEVMWPEKGSEESSGAYTPSIANNPQSAWTKVSTWEPITSPDLGNLGLSVAAFDYRCFAAFAINGKINIREFFGQAWQPAYQFQATKQSIQQLTAPVVTILGNEVFCFWQPSGDLPMHWSSRQVLRIPFLANWMDGVSNDKLISDLTIPGTHDTLAAAVKTRWSYSIFESLSSWLDPRAITQSLSITSQLDQGIRFFDLRGAYPAYLDDPKNPVGPIAVHGGWVCYSAGGEVLTIAKVLQEIYTWMDINGAQYSTGQTREAILVSVKLDDGEKVDATVKRFSTDIYNVITQTPEAKQRWRVAADVPAMGGTDGLRGRIQLLRRFKKPDSLGANDSFGINFFDGWPNGSYGPVPSGVDGKPPHQVQDDWRWVVTARKEIAVRKFGLIKQHMEEKRKDKTGALFLNFASANGHLSPREIALGYKYSEAYFYPGVLAKMLAYLTSGNEYGQFGIVIMDFAGEVDGLLAALVRTNFPK